MTNTNPRAYKYLTLSMRGRIIRRRSRVASYREKVLFKKFLNL